MTSRNDLLKSHLQEGSRKKATLKGIYADTKNVVFNIDGCLHVFSIKAEKPKPEGEDFEHMVFYSKLLPMNQECEVFFGLEHLEKVYIHGQVFFNLRLRGHQAAQSLFKELSEKKLIRTDLGSINLNFSGRIDGFYTQIKNSMENMSRAYYDQIDFEVDVQTVSSYYDSHETEMKVTGLRYETSEEKIKREEANAKKAQKAKEAAMKKKLAAKDKEKQEYEEFLRLKKKFPEG